MHDHSEASGVSCPTTGTCVHRHVYQEELNTTCWCLDLWLPHGNLVFQAGNATRNPTFMITIGIPDKIRHIPNHNEQVKEEHTLIIHKTIHTHMYIYISIKKRKRTYHKNLSQGIHRCGAMVSKFCAIVVPLGILLRLLLLAAKQLYRSTDFEVHRCRSGEDGDGSVNGWV